MNMKRTQVVHVSDRDEIRWHEQAEAPPIFLGNGKWDKKESNLWTRPLSFFDYYLLFIDSFNLDPWIQ